MQKLDRNDLYTLEKYSEIRGEYRDEVMRHKCDRRLPLGTNATLYFEDRVTIQYQVQEMLRIERIFEADGIQEELDAYNPLIPDGSNWKATFMVEFPDVEERRAMLRQLVGIEDQVWLKVGDGEKIRPIADEDLERDDEEKTSAVHFLRFELDPDSVKAVKAGADIKMGIDHEEMRCEVTLSDDTRKSLLQDLD